MLIRTGLSNLIAAFACGRSSTATAPPALPTADDRPRDQNASSGAGEQLELTLAGHLLIPVAVFVIAALTIDLSHDAKYITTVWPANAVILAALLRYVRSPGNCLSIFLGGACAMAIASLVAGNGAPLSAVLTVANTVEIATALALLSLFGVNASNLTSFGNMVIFMALAGIVAPIASDAGAAMAIGSVRDVPWRSVWLHLYPAHALGIIIVVPFLICLTSRQWQTALNERRTEAAAVLAIVIAVAICAAYFRSVMFIVVPAILFATMRFGLVGATAATLVTALIASVFVIAGIGEPLLSRPELSDRILALQVILAFTSLWSLPTAALLEERDRLLADLSSANALLKAESETKSHLVVGLRRHLSIAEENERLRLSHELHDQAGQGLIAAILELNEIDSSIDGPARGRLHQVRKRMEELGKTLHRIAWELRPPSIDELGLKKALASYIAEWGEQCGTDVDFHCDDPNLDEVPREIGTAVYRVVQEGLTNIVKHAQDPSDVSVVIRRVNATLQVIVEDDGCGFDATATAAKAASHHGLGLDGMRERLSLVGGTLEIESARGAGTTIFARIALDAQKPAA